MNRSDFNRSGSAVCGHALDGGSIRELSQPPEKVAATRTDELKAVQ